MFYPTTNKTYCVHNGRTMMIDEHASKSDMAKAILGFAREIAQETTQREVTFLLKISIASDEYAYQNQRVYQPMFEPDIELKEIVQIRTGSVTDHTYSYTFQKVLCPELV